MLIQASGTDLPSKHSSASETCGFNSCLQIRKSWALGAPSGLLDCSNHAGADSDSTFSQNLSLHGQTGFTDGHLLEVTVRMKKKKKVQKGHSFTRR